MRINTAIVLTVVLTAGSACASTTSSPTVATVAGGSVAGGSTASRAAAVHTAAECIRQHGIARFQDPTISPDGQVYSDLRPLQAADRNTIEAVIEACKELAAAADWQPQSEPPAPPAMVEAGVKAAQCLRAHGMANYRDPTPASAYTPGHGFALSDEEVPAGGKQDSLFQSATQACRSLLDAEIEASSLTNLAKR